MFGLCEIHHQLTPYKIGRPALRSKRVQNILYIRVLHPNFKLLLTWLRTILEEEIDQIHYVTDRYFAITISIP
jgi:hypothetical protein